LSVREGLADLLFDPLELPQQSRAGTCGTSARSPTSAYHPSSTLPIDLPRPHLNAGEGPQQDQPVLEETETEFEDASFQRGDLRRRTTLPRHFPYAGATPTLTPT